MPTFSYKLIHPDAKCPTRKRNTDAGYDIASVADVEILPGDSAIIPTGLKIEAPPGFYYTIEGRSGMLRDGIVASRGIIDATYTGDIFVILHNHGKNSYEVNVGDRIAQVVAHEIIHVDFCKMTREFAECGRADAGWGSSGK